MRRPIDIAGQRFGRLIAIETVPAWNEKARWRCKCDCGNTCIAYGTYLRNGTTRSCGCLSAETKRLSNAERVKRAAARTKRTTAVRIRLEDYFAPSPRVIDRSEKTWAKAEDAARMLAGLW